jgi:serine/threonine protein kinase
MFQNILQATYRSVTNTWQWTSQSLHNTSSYLFDSSFTKIPKEADEIQIPTETLANATLEQEADGFLKFTLQCSPDETETRFFKDEANLKAFLDTQTVNVWAVTDKRKEESYYLYFAFGEWQQHRHKKSLYRDILSGTAQGVCRLHDVSRASNNLTLISQHAPAFHHFPYLSYQKLGIVANLFLGSLSQSSLFKLGAASFVTAISPVSATFNTTLDLATVSTTPRLGVVLQGKTGSQTGYSVSGIGDINGDSIADMLIGSPYASVLDRGYATGEAYLLFGRNSSNSWLMTLDLALVSNTTGLGVVLQGASGSDTTGYSVSGINDINGDGVNDMLIGAYRASPFGRTQAGEVYLLFGRNSSNPWPMTLDLALVSNTTGLGVVLQGAVDGDSTGIFVSGTGDVNGDSNADMLIGATGASPLNRGNAGEVYLLFGRNSSNPWPMTLDLALVSNTTGLGVVLQGAASNDYTGGSVSSLNDINGDDIADMLVGARETNDLGPGSGTGRAYLLFGRNSSNPWPSTLDLATVNVTQGIGVILQGAAGDHAGGKVSLTNDVNGDGISDMLISAYKANVLGRGDNTGQVYMLFGRNSSNPWPSTLDLATVNVTQGIGVILQGAAGDYFTGDSLSSVRDANGDGIADMLIGSPYASVPGPGAGTGRVYLLFGRNKSNPWLNTFDLGSVSQGIGVVLQGVSTNDQTGWSVSGLSDINGDNIDDMLIGAIYPNVLGRGAYTGVAYLLFGQNSSVLLTTLATTFAATSPTTGTTHNPTTGIAQGTTTSEQTSTSATTSNPVFTTGQFLSAVASSSSFSSTVRATTQRVSSMAAVSSTGSILSATGNAEVTSDSPTLTSSSTANSLSSTSNGVSHNGQSSSILKSGIPLNIVIGAAVGGVVCITLSIGGLVFVLHRRKKAKSLQETNDTVELATQSSALADSDAENPNASLYAMYANFKHALSADIYNQSAGQLILGHKYVVYLMVDRSTAEELKAAKGIDVSFSKGIYETEYSLGKGQFGRLLIGKNRETDEFVAIKSVTGEHQVAKSRSEAKLQSLLSGKPNVMPLLDSVEIPTPEGNYLFQVMPIASFGNGDYLYHELSFSNDAKLKEALIVHVAKSLLIGLQHMHQAHIYHLDMKPANFVIDLDGEVSIIDFGCSQRVSGNDGIIVGGTGDTCYYSPERLAHARRNTEGLETNEITPHFFGAKADAWALGVTLLILRTKDSPFWQADIWQRLRSWDSAFFTKKLAEIPELQQPAKDSIWAVIKGLLEVDHAKRLTMAAALAMPVFERKDLILGKEKLSNAFANIKKAEAESKKAFVYTPKVQNKNYHTAGKVAVSNQQASNSSVAKNPQGFFNPNNRSATTQDFSKDYGILPEENKTKSNLYHSRH